MSEATGTLNVNGALHEVQLAPERRLLTVLRDELELTGAKYGCGEGECGACTVLVDGAAKPACQLWLSEALGHALTSVEGLARAGVLHPVQRAFVELSALQCGYCTPGMILGAVALLASNPDPSPQQIAQALERHVCRCGGYSRIVRAVLRAAEMMRASAEPVR